MKLAALLMLMLTLKDYERGIGHRRLRLAAFSSASVCSCAFNFFPVSCIHSKRLMKVNSFAITRHLLVSIGCLERNLLVGNLYGFPTEGRKKAHINQSSGGVASFLRIIV